MTAPIILHRCNYCSRQLLPARCHRLESQQVVCDDCLAWHFHALDVLGGAIPRGCQECGLTWEKLRETEISVDIRMYVVPKDGIMQILCRNCIRRYAAKRPDLYRNTDFGRNVLKL